MSNNLENINPYNLSDIYNFLLTQDESYFSSSLTPEGLDTCVKIAEYFSGNLKKEEIVSISNDSLKDFIKKHTVKPDEIKNPEVVANIKEKAKTLHNKLHPLSLDLSALPIEMSQDGTLNLSKLPKEMRQDAIFEDLDGWDLVSMSRVSKSSHDEISAKDRLVNRINVAKHTDLLYLLESFIDAGVAKGYGGMDNYYHMISKARIFIGDYEGSKTTMNKIKYISRYSTKYQDAKNELLTAKIKNGDYEGAISEALEKDTKLDSNESAKLKSMIYYSVAEEYAKKGNLEEAHKMLEEGKKQGLSIENSDQDLNEVNRNFTIALAKIGEIDKAKKAVKELDEISKAQAIIAIASIQAEAGDFLGAKETIREEDSLFNNIAFQEVIKLQLQGKDLNETLVILKEETKEPQNEDENSLQQIVASEIIQHLVILGEVQVAKELFISSKLTDDLYQESKKEALLPLVKAFVAKGMTEEALGLCSQYDDTVHHHALIGAAIETARHNVDKAKEILEPIEIDLKEKEWHLVQILIAGGKFDEAKEAFDKCRWGDNVKIKRLVEIMKEQIEHGETDAVLAMIDKLEHLSQVQVYTALITGKMED